MTSDILTRSAIAAAVIVCTTGLALWFGGRFAARVLQVFRTVTCLLGAPVLALAVIAWVCGGHEAVLTAGNALWQSTKDILADLPMPLEEWIAAL